MDVVTPLAGALIVVGLLGVVVPVLPGLLLVWGAVAVWAVVQQDLTAWVALGVATVFLVAGSVAKYLLPGRRLRASGVPWRSLALGGVLGVVGFFVVPVLGLLIGFVLGVYLAELARLHDRRAAWPSTRAALVATGWSMLIELFSGLLMASTWVVAVLVS
jgi:uncharacterized protein YqgC (DUF456 family)